MDIDDRPDPDARGYSAGSPFLHPDWVQGTDPAHAAGSAIGRRSLVQGLASRWWQILGLWLVVSTPVIYLIYSLVEPSYEAVCLLRVEPAAPVLYGPDAKVPSRPSEDLNPYLLTQTELIRSDGVLDAALADPKISSLPMVRSSKSPKTDLRKEMGVAIVGGDTHLLQVSLALPDPASAAAIVNAVVDSYIEQHYRYQQTGNRALKKSIESELHKLEAQIAYTQEKLRKLVAVGRLDAARQIIVPLAGKGEGGPVGPSLSVVTEDQYKVLANRMLEADFELMDARARLETARLPGSQTPAEKLREREAAAEEAARKRLNYSRYLAQLKVGSGPNGPEQFEASLLSQDLQHLRKLDEVLKTKRAQLEFEIDSERYRISVQDKASVPRVPSSDRRFLFSSLASAGALFVILTSFLVGEIGARRRAAPGVAS